ncbi:UDP-N-acetylmuramate dehydrogenase [Puniceicoccaceae bacterium K14]|nr:UDP-N-acetylmuramate dehydrogenase [Puniceicoccaceae bacterium K14]
MKLSSNNRIHCLGAAGAGMLPLALMAKQSGFAVTAQDDSMTEKAKRMLEQSGVEIVVGEDWISSGKGTVIRSSAIPVDGGLVQSALAEGWRVCRRGEFFAEMSGNTKLVAIVGSHGKTTTTAMLHEWLGCMNVEHSLMLGGLFEDDQLPGQLGGSDWLIAEVDESDGTIEGFSPEIAVILNVDYDHHTQYPTEKDYRSAFQRLASRTSGKVVASVEVCEMLDLKNTIEQERLVVVGAGGDVSFDFKESFKGGGRLDIKFAGSTASVTINRSSDFNVSNAVFAAIAATEIGGREHLPQSVFFPALERRQSCNFLSPTLSVFNDYAHHPEEITRQIASLKKQRNGELWVVFQPHRFSRTRHLVHELAKSLAAANRLYLLDVYAASEQEVEGGRGVDLHVICQEQCSDCRFLDSEDALLDLLENEVDPSQELSVLFLGAGMTHLYAKKFASRVAVRDARWGAFSKVLGEGARESSQLKSNEPLAKKTTMRVGGSAERYLEPASEVELSVALAAAKKFGISVQMLGRGSNLIVPDTGVRGLVIRLNHPFWKQYRMLDDERVWIGAGMRIKELCGVAAKLGLAGFEFLEGIPGNLGGALRMNAGAMGGWTFDVVESVRFIGMDGKVYERKRAQLTYGYRHCRELEDTVAIGAVLRANASGRDREEIRASIGTYQEKRHESQPREPSAGCIFKNPEGDSAGRIIDELGLKGTAIGGAKISEIHGNFIVNTGGATSEDVIELVKLARRVAQEKKHIELEPEALLYGAEWKEFLR